MSLKTSHVLIHSSEDALRKQPAILINNNLILAHGSILNYHSLGTNPTVHQSLKNYQPYFINKNNNFNFYITYELKRKLYSKQIYVHSVYNVKNLSTQLSRTVLQRFSVTNNENDLFLSTFLLFSLNEAFDYTLIMRNLYDNYIKLNYININCLDRIITYATPFNYDIFHSFIASGYISNIFNDSNSNLFIVDLNSPYNQIGQAIYNEVNNLIGVIIVNSLEFLNDRFTAVLVGNFYNIIENILLQLNLIKNIKSIVLNSNHRNDSIYSKIKNYSILIKNNQFLGTGCFVRINSKRFIMSCSHILNSGDPNENNIICYYKNIKFKIEKIIFYNSSGKDVNIFDISILEIPANIPINDQNFTEIKNYKRNELTNKLIYSIGFPQFSVVDDEWNPSVYKGRVVKSKRGVLFTNVLVQAGQSGGPLVDGRGHLIGISILNLKHGDTIYPNLNMAVPICDIYEVLDKYSKTNDTKILDDMISNDKEIEKAWTLEKPVINHKL